MNKVFHIYRKEIREMIRDRRVITGAFIAPIFLIVLMLGLFGFLNDTIKKPKPAKVVIVKSDHPSELETSLPANPMLRSITVDSLEEAKRKLDSGEAKAILQFAPNFQSQMLSGGAKLTVTYEEGEPTSQMAVGTIEGIISKTNESIVRAVFKDRGLPPSLCNPIVVERKESKKSEGLGSSMIVGMLPYLIVIWAFYGGFSIVSDMVAGEKERGTMETLLITPTHRWQIGLGKFLSLSTVCFVSAMTSLVGVLVVGMLQLPFTKGLFPEGVHVSISSIAAILVVLIPLVGFFSGVLLAVSAFAKNMREAQTYLTLVSFIVLMPAIFSQFIGFTDMGKQTWVAFTPILNSSVAIREALLGKADWTHVGIAVAANLLVAVVGLRVVVWLFNREEILGRV